MGCHPEDERALVSFPRPVSSLVGDRTVVMMKTCFFRGVSERYRGPFDGKCYGGQSRSSEFACKSETTNSPVLSLPVVPDVFQPFSHGGVTVVTGFQFRASIPDVSSALPSDMIPFLLFLPQQATYFRPQGVLVGLDVVEPGLDMKGALYVACRRQEEDIGIHCMSPC